MFDHIYYKISPTDYILNTDAIIEPFTLDYVKDYLRISNTDDDVLTTIDSSIYYFTDNNEYSSILVKDGQSWATDADNRKQAIKITFVSGYGATADDVPQGIKTAMLAHIANMYENRGDCSDCDIAFKNSKAASLYSPYRLSSTMLEVVHGLW